MKKSLTIMGLFAAFSMFLISCGGPSQKEIDTQARIESEHAADSLHSYLLQNVNIQEGVAIEITEFTPKDCSLRITVPEEMGSKGADVVGKGICVLTAKWLTAQKYDVSLGNIFVYCSVISPYVGVTEKPDMVTRWGRAMYDANTDSVKWDWEKSK